MKKRLLTLLLMGCMMLSLAACGKKEDKNDNSKQQTETDAEDAYSALGKSKLAELGEYKGITYTPMSEEVTDEEVEAQVQEIVANSTLKNPQETVTETSVVNIDYVGKKDGVAFENGAAKDQELDIANSGYIPGFAESIVGMKVGETKDCPMTFPEDYKNSTELAGADVVFTITVNECWENVPAELNEEFAKSQDCENVEDFYAKVRQSLEESKKYEASSEKRYQILTTVIANSTFDINDEEVALYKNQIQAQYENMAAMYGVDLETYVVSGLGVDMEQFESDCTGSAMFRLQSALVRDAIAKKENIVVTDEEYESGVAYYMSNYNYTDKEAFEEAMGKESIMQQLLYDKVVVYLEENAVSAEE